MNPYNFKFCDKYNFLSSNFLSSDELSALEPKIKEIDQLFRAKKTIGSEMSGWADATNYLTSDIIDDVNNFAAKWQKNIDTLVVCGIGGSYLGSRAVHDILINHKNKDINVIWLGHTFSSNYVQRCLNKLKQENCNFGLVVISKSGTTFETLINFRLLRDLLIKKHGLKKAHELMAFVTGSKGTLLEYAQKNQVKVFDFPTNIGGRFSVISPCGLLPLAILGHDINAFTKGFKVAEIFFKNKNDLSNEAYRYAANRVVLSKKYISEIMVLYDEDAWYFAESWKQLIAESEGKNKKGLLPNSTIFPFGLHSIGQYIQEGKKCFFETVLHTSKVANRITIPHSENNYDNLNFLTGVSFNDLIQNIFQGVLKAHGPIGKNPNLVIDLDEINPETIGFLIHFFFLATVMSCYLQDLNPFDQPGVEIYKKQVMEILNKKYNK